MNKIILPLNRCIYTKNSSLIYNWRKNLYRYFKEDEFGYIILTSNINKKGLKFIKKTFNPFIFLNPVKNYAIFVNFSKPYQINTNKKINSVILKNFIDNGIYIYEII